MSEVLHEVMAKGVRAEGMAAARPNWVTAPRRVLRATSEALEFGDWRLPYAEIADAELASGRDTPIAPPYVLNLRHGGARYRFGLERQPGWLGALPIEVRGLQRQRRLYPAVSIAIRIAFVLALAYWLIRSCAP